MALPKYKMSRARTRRRKAQWRNDHKLPTLTDCAHCRKRIPTHTGCPYCGYYKGKAFKTVKTEV